jgi:hypothetical protein
MTITNAIITRIQSGKTINLGRVTKGKMNMFRKLQANGEDVVAFFDDCGEFSFEWNKKSKTWVFLNEAGEMVGVAKVERDYDAERANALAYYEEKKAAYNAFLKMKASD